MEIQPVVEHESTDERVEKKSQPADEVWEEYNPLMGLRSGDDLSLGQKSVGDFLGQIPGLPELCNILLLDGGDHPLAPRSIFGHGSSAF